MTTLPIAVRVIRRETSRAIQIVPLDMFAIRLPSWLARQNNLVPVRSETQRSAQLESQRRSNQC
jgi:hypothetical protein